MSETGGSRKVVFEVDTGAYLEREEQLDSVVRELQLLAMGRDQPLRADSAARLLQVVQGFMRGFAHIRLNNRVQGQTATRHGEPRVRLVMVLRPEAAEVAASFLRLLDDIDGYWRESGLLAWSQTPAIRAVRHAMLDAIVTQLQLADSDR